MDMDGPLDFENEDPLVNPPATIEKRKKVIGLDDLLTDFYKEKSKQIDKENRKRKASKLYDSDEDEHGQTALLSIVDDCQNQMNEIAGEEDIHEWGLSMLGEQVRLIYSHYFRVSDVCRNVVSLMLNVQKTPIPSLHVDIDSCSLLKEFMSSQINMAVDLIPDNGATFLEGLLVNGWLTKLILECARVEKFICKWTLNMLLYSSKEDLRSSACDFWCSILLSHNKVTVSPVEIGLLPNYEELKEAFESYGFRISSSKDVELAEANSESQGPPQNIRTWLKFVAACCQIRCKKPFFSTSQVEQIAEILVLLLLDRGLQGVSLLIQECLISVIGSFKEKEWVLSCKKIADSLASRVPHDMNCLRIVESISGVDARSKHLRSSISNQMLVVLLDRKESDEKLLSSLMSINVKEKSCNLLRAYICLVLAENWLFFSSNLLEEKPVLKEMWSVFLRNCSCQINSTDLRSYASKVRTKAAYLLQGCSSY